MLSSPLLKENRFKEISNSLELVNLSRRQVSGLGLVDNTYISGEKLATSQNERKCILFLVTQSIKIFDQVNRKIPL